MEYENQAFDRIICKNKRMNQTVLEIQSEFVTGRYLREFNILRIGILFLLQVNQNILALKWIQTSRI